MKNLHNRLTVYTSQTLENHKSMNKIPFIWLNNTYVISKNYNQIDIIW